MSNNGHTPDTITPASEWRRPSIEGVVFHFPSGHTAKVRPVNTDTFIRLSQIPDMLTSLVGALIDNGSEQSMQVSAVQNAQKQMDIFNAFCVTALVEPRCVMSNPQDGEISVDDISDEDKQKLFEFLGKPASALASFRPKQENPVDNMERVESDPASA